MDLTQWFTQHAVLVSCVEKTLTLQQDYADSVRMVWNATGESFTMGSGLDTANCADVVIDPLDIRTFVLSFQST